jgi:dephospho-CoA kinase
LAAQRKWTADEVAARENAQMSENEKKSHAHAVLDNSGSAEQLQAEIEALLKRWGIDSLNKENLDHG